MRRLVLSSQRKINCDWPRTRTFDYNLNWKTSITSSRNSTHVSNAFRSSSSFDQLDTFVQGTRQLEVSVANNHLANAMDSTSMRTDFYPASQSSADNQQAERDYHGLQGHTTASLAPTLDKRVTARASPAMSLLTSNMNNLRDPFAPQPYDPINGFVIFFDFILNLPNQVEQCCLITCLHHPKSGLGEPSQLDIFKCTAYVDERHGERMSVAMIAMKQPVPRFVSKREWNDRYTRCLADVHRNKR